MFTRASASGLTSDARMPVRARLTGPLTRRHRHGVLTTPPAGAWSAVQMTEISVGVQVTETTPCPASSPVGNAAPASRRHTA